MSVKTALHDLRSADPEIFAAIQGERRRQTDGIELIASENYVSRAVLEAQGSVLTNKYAEGYPGRRYYGGCDWVDVAERLAMERARALFGAEHANVQPHSGSQANLAAYLALLRPGDRIMAMDLAHGGHLTHGSPVNLSGQIFEFVAYGVDRETEQLDYDQIEALAREHRPRLIVAGATAYPRSIDFACIGQIAESVGAYFMVDMAHIAGLVATKLHPDPVPYAHIVTSTTHKTLRGPRGGLILCHEAFASAVDRAIFPGTQGGPLMHVIAAKAVAFKEAMEPAFADYQRQIVANARALAEELAAQGLRIVSGGTDNHLLLVDLSPVGVTGRDAEKALDEVGITVNKNLIPYDERPPRVTSGIRLGTPAVTTRGFREEEARHVARLIATVVRNIGDEGVYRRVRGEVRDLCARFPVPGIDV